VLRPARPVRCQHSAAPPLGLLPSGEAPGTALFVGGARTRTWTSGCHLHADCAQDARPSPTRSQSFRSSAPPPSTILRGCSSPTTMSSGVWCISRRTNVPFARSEAIPSRGSPPSGRATRTACRQDGHPRRRNPGTGYRRTPAVHESAPLQWPPRLCRVRPARAGRARPPRVPAHPAEGQAGDFVPYETLELFPSMVVEEHGLALFEAVKQLDL
jgi:hypothetical protein